MTREMYACTQISINYAMERCDHSSGTKGKIKMMSMRPR